MKQQKCWIASVDWDHPGIEIFFTRERKQTISPMIEVSTWHSQQLLYMYLLLSLIYMLLWPDIATLIWKFITACFQELNCTWCFGIKTALPFKVHQIIICSSQRESIVVYVGLHTVCCKSFTFVFKWGLWDISTIASEWKWIVMLNIIH